MAKPSFPDASSEQVSSALRAAEKAFSVYRQLPGERRARFLEAIADGLERDAEKIIELANSETSLGLPRLQVELQRTAEQGRLFAELARTGAWLEPRSDEAEPERKPLPKPGLRSHNIPLGPVVVMGACNFPLAISVVGTDTMSALAVGCTVVVKAHHGHPATCEKLSTLIHEAAKETDMPDGAFSLLHGESHRVGRELVQNPSTKAVAFTGSLKGGKALATVAANRPEPIPFYAEMGSLNPLFVLPGALRERSEEIATGYVAAVTLSAGQMCTKPGMLVTIEGPSLERFLKQSVLVTRESSPVAMLNAGIRDNFEANVERFTKSAKLIAASEQAPNSSANEASCQLFVTDASDFLGDPNLQTEAFGPSSIIVRVKDEKALLKLANSLEGTLTASLHVGEGDCAIVDKLLPILESKAGRVLWNGFPPGVVPTHATHHGGPWPATTDSRHTSIGIFGYRRFVRPICRQGFPSP